MEENYKKYAELLLKGCLNIKKKEPLLIQVPIENIDFVRVLAKTAYELGVDDVYFDFEDNELKREQLLNLDLESLKKSRFWNKAIFDEYAKKGAAFLMLYGDDPDLTKDVDDYKAAEVAKTYRTSRPVYKEKQNINEVSWCIAGIPTLQWAKKVFPNSIDPKQDLWNAIFKMCLIDKENPIEEWEKANVEKKLRCDKLNELKLKELHYRNSLGTDLNVCLSKDAIWGGGAEKLKDGRVAILNMPTIEVFTTPDYRKTNGIVYSAKPLVYNGTIIDEFMLKFEEGKVVGFDAKKGLETLRSIIEGDNQAAYLGECALVEHDSPISASKILFYETLFDENASCHLALGAGFPTSVNNTENNTSEQLLEKGINVSTVHVDFMIGTEDLDITGITYTGEKVKVFTKGKFDLK